MNTMRMYLIIKRLTDIIVSIFCLLLLSPTLIIVSLLIRLTFGSPVMFCQIRPGLHGKPFRMIKFRTMTNECDENGHLLSDEKRITKFGMFLRKTSIDELPELLNVLKGDMSLVGPRPLLMQYLPLYTPGQARRHEVKPGITGLAQVNGRNAITMEERFVFDVWYVDHYSALLDIKILILTILKVIRKENIVTTDTTMNSPFIKEFLKENTIYDVPKHTKNHEGSC
jgi:lipopolysaccharide/colanic/teichoic acid biosynthesis glycosyltransferase